MKIIFLYKTQKLGIVNEMVHQEELTKDKIRVYNELIEPENVLKGISRLINK